MDDLHLTGVSLSAISVSVYYRYPLTDDLGLIGHSVCVTTEAAQAKGKQNRIDAQVHGLRRWDTVTDQERCSSSQYCRLISLIVIAKVARGVRLKPLPALPALPA